MIVPGRPAPALTAERLPESAPLRSSRRTLVLGGYGVGNLGDEAILAGLLSLLERDSLTVVSRSPADTAALHGVRSVSMRSALAALLRSQALIIGGGGLFSSHMGAFGHLIPAFGQLASALGKRVHLVGVGIDSGLSGPFRASLLALARRCDSVSVRDPGSRSLLSAAGIEASVVPDLALFAPAASPERAIALLDAAGLSRDRPLIGLALNAVERGSGGRLATAVADLAAAVPEAQLCFLPLSRHPNVTAQDDLALAKALGAAVPTLRLVDGCDDPADAIAIFARFDLAVCMRFHSLVFAERAGTPIVALPYAQKCDRWLVERGLRPTELSGEALTAAVTAALRSREKVAA